MTAATVPTAAQAAPIDSIHPAVSVEATTRGAAYVGCAAAATGATQQRYDTLVWRETRLRREAAEVFREPVSFRVRQQRVVGQGHATGVLNRPAYRVGRLRERRRGNRRCPPTPVTASERPSRGVDGLDEITNVGSVDANVPCFQPCYAASVQ